jgi:hypothetical protein
MENDAMSDFVQMFGWFLGIGGVVTVMLVVRWWRGKGAGSESKK